MSTNVQAPGGLAVVQRLLNTWSVPNDTRVEHDRLPDLVRDGQLWAAELSELPRPTDASAAADLHLVRDEIRSVLGDPRPPRLTGLLERHPVRVTLADAGAARPIAFEPVGEEAADRVVAHVLNAIDDGTWPRLKACPDCRYVFYDVTRNGSRTWCAMSPDTPEGRGCGGIAKSRAHRARRDGSARAGATGNN